MIFQIIQYQCETVVGSDLPADRDYSDFDFDFDSDWKMSLALGRISIGFA
jgi:hypothetical protein